MSKRVHFTPEEKYESIMNVLNEVHSCHFESTRIGVVYATLKDWIRKYQTNGRQGLEESRTWKKYSAELKKEAVQSVLSGKESVDSATTTFNISSTSVLNRWIRQYTGNDKKQHTISKGRLNTMNHPGRKTTFKERLEIVKYTLAYDKNYQKAIETYQVSYHQVYHWVKKYETHGEDGLQDKRGRNKSTGELTEEEKLNLRIKELEARNEQLEMEVAVRKKLKEVQDRFQL